MWAQICQQISQQQQKVIAYGEASHQAYLVLSYFQSGHPNARAMFAFGQQLAHF